MLKIRRIHIVNAGFEEATFDGECFDFRDPESGDPAHGVLHAENGTGKTTALGLIFNMPVPKEARFLPHLVKPDYQFTDYFPRGVGAVAVEWHDPAGRHPVTVHFVVPQLRGSERQTWRRWTLFRSGPGLAFDDLPLKGLAGRSSTAFGGRDDVAAWLRDHEDRFADSHDFEAAATQEAWRRILERHGIDTHLMDSQLEFNRQEGGLDTFLKISGEEDFITRFLGLCLVSPDQGVDAMAEPVCAQVRTIVARMQGYDKLVAKRNLLSDLEQSFHPFANIASAWREQGREVVRAETHAASVKQAAILRAQSLESLASDAEQAAQQQMRRQEELKAEASRAELAAEAARLAIAEARAGAADEERQRAIAVATQAQQRRARLSAARDLRDILSIEAEIAGYEHAVSEAETDAEEPRRRAHAAGAALKALLLGVAAEYRQGVEREREAATTADSERYRARAAVDGLRREMTAAQREDAALETKIKTAEEALLQLQADAVVRPGESLAAAIARLESERDEADGAARDATARVDEHEAAAQAATEAFSEFEAARREALVQAEAARRSVEKAEQAREALIRSQSWQQHLGPSVAFGPDAALTASRQARDQSDEGRRQHARADLLHQDADRITRHRVAAVDRNVDLVLARLADAGFRSAIAAASWLADIIGDADRLRAFAAADPAAFAGVFVQDPAELARVPAVGFAGLALDRPVAIQSPTEEPGGAVVFAVIPERIEAYDVAAAEALVEDLGAKLGEAKLAAETAVTTAEALNALKHAIESWIAEWGGGKLESIHQRVAEQEASARRAEAEVAAARRRSEGERRAAAEARSLARSQAERSAVAQRGRTAAMRWQQLYGEPLPQWRAQRGRLMERLAELVEQEALEQARADAAQQRAEQARSAIRDRERAIGDFQAEAERIEYCSSERSEEIRSIEDGRALYRAAAEVLRRVMEDRLGPLQGTLDARRQDLSTRNERLRSEHGALADDREALLDDTRSPVLDELLVAARGAERRADEAVGLAKGEAVRLETEARRHQAAFARFGEMGMAAHAALAGCDLAQLQGRLAAAEETARVAVLEADRAAEIIAEARQRATRLTSDADRLRDRARPLPERPAPAMDLRESLSEALGEIDDAYKRLEAAAAELRRRGLALNEAYDGFRREAHGHRDRALEGVLIDTLVANEVEPAAEDAERLRRLLADRIATLEQEIAEYEADKNRAVGEMDALLLSAVNLFQRAINRGVVPDHVPRFGGRRILAMAFRPPSTEGEAAVAVRRSLCEGILLDYVAANEVPQTDHAMAAALLERYARSVQMRRPDEAALGLRLLKSNDQGRIHHLPVAAFKASGGETLTSAMLLYLLVARLRSEGRASQRARIGGVLILDNPLGKASNSLFIKMQLALAKAMDVQLIFTTAIKDWAAVGEFPQVVKLRKESTDPATGRIFVKVTHQWIGDPEPSADRMVGEAAQ